MQEILFFKCYICEPRADQHAMVAFGLPQHLLDIGKKGEKGESGDFRRLLQVHACVPHPSASPDPRSPRRSRSVVQINASIRFEPSKINIFTKDCKRNGKDATCMSAFVCFTAVFLSAHFQTASVGKRHGGSCDKNPNSGGYVGLQPRGSRQLLPRETVQELGMVWGVHIAIHHIPFFPTNLSLSWLM